MGLEHQIDPALAKALGVEPNCVPSHRASWLDGLLSQTTRQERCTLYALARYGYTGFGDVFDIGCAAGGSTACLAAGVADGPVSPKSDRVHAFDLFDGYSLKAFADPLAARGLQFQSDLRLFAHQNRTHRGIVHAHQLDLTRPFKQAASKQNLEIVHIDAAKTQQLWTSIATQIGGSIIPKKTVWIFQDFERVRLPWQVWAMDTLLLHGHIIGGAPHGTIYFRFDSALPPSVLQRVATPMQSVDDALAAVDRVYTKIASDWSHLFETDGLSPDDFRIGTRAYCHFWHGDPTRARKAFLDTSARFRSHPHCAAYLQELAIF